jgi:hypothetical protein
MLALLPLALAAAVVAASPGAPAAGGGASVQASATVTILRAERASETAERGGLVRHVSRSQDGQTTINFE